MLPMRLLICGLALVSVASAQEIGQPKRASKETHNQPAVQTVRILVAGDGRADYPWNNKRREDVEGINDTITREICKEALALQPRPDALLWTGDIVNVNETAGCKPEDKTNFLRNGLNKWKQIMQPLYKEKIAVLPVRGNHEVEWHEPKDWTPNEIASATKVWNEVFPELTLNDGPECEKGLSFLWEKKPVLCIGLDQYENRLHLINQHWLDDVLAKHRQPFIFAYGHEAAFATGGHHNKDECLAAYPHRRDQMWKSLSDAGARVYFCGHDHFYDHMEVQSSTTRLGYEMHQFAAGTAGAPFYDSKPYPEDEDWQLKCLKHINFTYGYILVTIDGNTAKIVFKGRDLDGHYTEKDSFIYTVDTP